jgi:hypothetical protein
MKRLAIAAAFLAALAPAGCATTGGSASGAGFYSDLSWYDTWYWGTDRERAFAAGGRADAASRDAKRRRTPLATACR